MSLAATAGPIAETPVHDVAVVFEGDEPVCAIRRWCPHRGCDLARHGRAGSRPRTLACKHAGYEWDAVSGEVLGVGSTGPAGRLAVAPIAIRRNGTVVTCEGSR